MIGWLAVSGIASGKGIKNVLSVLSKIKTVLAGKAAIEPIEKFCLSAIICVGKGKSGERDEIRAGLTIRKYLGPTRKGGLRNPK